MSKREDPYRLRARLSWRLLSLQAALLVALVAVVVGALSASGFALAERDEDRVIEMVQRALAHDAQGNLTLRPTSELQQLRRETPDLWFLVRDRQGRSLTEGAVPPEFAAIGSGLDQISQARLGWQLFEDDPRKPAARLKRVDSEAGNVQIITATQGRLAGAKALVMTSLAFLGIALPGLLLMGTATFIATPVIVRRAFKGLDATADQARRIDIHQRGARLSQDPTCTAPIINPNRHSGDLNNIVVGLSRGFNSPANNTDVDYWFWQTQWQNTTLILPVTGSMYFKYPIASLNANNPIPFVYLARVEGGMSELQVTGLSMAQFSIDPVNPNKLNFSFVAGTNDAGTALNFGLSPWVSNTKTYLTFKIVVTLNAPGQPGLQGWSTIMSTDVPNTDPNDGVTTIKPIIFVWHCLVAGTQVTMSDNTTKSVELIQVGDQVLTPSGVQAVQANLAQPHFGTAYTLTLTSGKTISGSGTHPVITPGGPVQISALQVGNTVLTLNGNDTVASVSTFQQNGDGLFNLWLDGSTGSNYFYAGGIEVGDYTVQTDTQEVERLSPDRIRNRLPEEWLTDFNSHIEDHASACK